MASSLVDLIFDIMTGSITGKSALWWIPVAIWAIVFLGFSVGFLMAENWIGTWFCIAVSAIFPVLRLIKTGLT
jgi:hypothetical protein